MLSQYKDFIENCLLFRTSTGKIDISLAQSLLQEIRIERYLIDEYIIKAGQSTTKTILVIDGFIKVILMNQRNIEGYLEPGDFYSTDLNETHNIEFDKQYFLQTNGCESPGLELSSLDNLDNKTICHFVADSMVTVGILSIESMEILVRGFP